MDARVREVLTAYEERSRREWAGQVEGSYRQVEHQRDLMLLSVGPDAGRFLNSLVRGGKAQRILELGTSYGYSTVWLAEAAKEVGGRVTTIDVADYKQAYAREQLEKCGLADVVEFKTGDALQLLPQLEGGYEVVLLDIWKDAYLPVVDLLYPKLAPGAVVVADNMIYPAADRPHILAYRRAFAAKPRIRSVLLQIGQGLEVSRLDGPYEEGL